MANTLSVSGLTSFIDEKRDELFVKSVAGAKTLDYVEIYPGVKYKTALNYLDSTVVLADGILRAAMYSAKECSKCTLLPCRRSIAGKVCVKNL